MSGHIEINNKENCCGCGACSSICPVNCITLIKDHKGFDYPQIDEKICIECGACIRVCPFINQYNEEFGPIECFAAINDNEEERLLSSSGGIFILLARKIIATGGVVFGAVFTEEMTVSHVCTDTCEGLIPMMGSKYVQSHTGEIFKNVKDALKEGKKVLFTGTQCQIAGLNHYIGNNDDNLITVELICHGAPSPEVWKEYLKNITAHYQQEHKTEGMEKIQHEDDLCKTIPYKSFCSFRDKSNGWKKYGMKITCAEQTPLSSSDLSETNRTNGKNSPNIILQQYHRDNPFMKAFLQNYILRPSCYACKAKSGLSHADITLGDFWGIKEFLGNKEDDKGISALIIRTEKGRKLIFALTGIELEKTTYQEILNGNPSLEKSVLYPQKYKEFWKVYNKHGLEKALKNINHISFFRRGYSFLRRTGKHIFNLNLNK